MCVAILAMPGISGGNNLKESTTVAPKFVPNGLVTTSEPKGYVALGGDKEGNRYLELYYSHGIKAEDNDIDDIVTFLKIPVAELPLTDGCKIINKAKNYEIVAEWTNSTLTVTNTYKRKSLGRKYKTRIVSHKYDVKGLSPNLEQNSATISDASRWNFPGERRRNFWF